MLNVERKEDMIYYTTEHGETVGTIQYTPKGEWLVLTAEKYNHGTSTMWWRTLKAAEYHMLALYENASI